MDSILSLFQVCVIFKRDLQLYLGAPAGGSASLAALVRSGSLDRPDAGVRARVVGSLRRRRRPHVGVAWGRGRPHVGVTTNNREGNRNRKQIPLIIKSLRKCKEVFGKCQTLPSRVVPSAKLGYQSIALLNLGYTIYWFI